MRPVCPSFGCPILRKLSASGGFCPLTPSLPLDPAGGSASRPVIGLHFALAMVRAPPLFFIQVYACNFNIVDNRSGAGNEHFCNLMAIVKDVINIEKMEYQTGI